MNSKKWKSDISPRERPVPEPQPRQYPAIGNDIVDLQDSDAIGILGNKRFIERVFTDREQQAIFNSADPERFLWAIWACKESAYKVMRRIKPETIFSHKKFEVESGLSIISHGQSIIHCKVTFYPDMILASAVTGGHLQHAENRIGKIASSSHAQIPAGAASAAARDLLYAMASETFNLAKPAISVNRDHDKAPPVLMHGENVLSEAISLSHHGRYVAASLYTF